MADLRLGGVVDPGTHQRTDDPVAVPSDELTTHGVIVGMTGSGKTGLGVVLIEECLRSGVPALLIPLPKLANDHQTANAKAMQALGCGACPKNRQAR